MLSIAHGFDGGRTQSFTYDHLNRIQTAQVPTAWGLSFAYDIWGNLLQQTVTQGSAPMLNVAATPANRIVGFCYDAAGNLTHQGACPGVTYTYDAENRLTTTAGVSYVYDGDGKRVQKSNGTLYWHGLAGEVLVETDLAGTLLDEYVFFDGKRIARRAAAGAVYYFFADHLGSSRIVTDSSGTIVEDSDFYPFGAERVVVDNLNNNYKFTGQERDTESGLDYFRARHYAYTLGRFSQTDPALSFSRTVANPQKWNRYTYVLNNPLAFFDPNGKEELTVTVRTYVPTPTTSVLGRTFVGDGNSATSRTKQTFRVETDASKSQQPLKASTKETGVSKELNAGGEVTRSAQSSGETLAGGASRNADGSVTVTASGNEANPLITSPGISYDFSLTVSQDGSYQLTGSHDGFPAYKVTVTGEDGTTTEIYSHDPQKTGETPYSLFPPKEHDVNKKGQLPPPSNNTTDSKDKEKKRSP